MRSYGNKNVNNHIDDNYIETLIHSYNSGSPAYFAGTLIYNCQGYRCNDCSNIYLYCECEKCPDCNWRKCLCFLNIENKSIIPHSSEIHYKIRNETLALAKKDLSKKQLKYFYSKLNNDNLH